MTRTTLALVLAAAAGCGEVKNTTDAAVTPDDGATPDMPGSSPACDLAKPFGAAAEVPNLHEATANDQHATLTGDELTLYFASDRTPGGKWHIYTATRASVTSPFSAPTQVGATFSAEGESNPSISPDGNTIYFDSYRVTAGLLHIFTSTRSSAGVVFPTPTMITGDYLLHPSVTADGSALFTSNIQSGGLARLDRTGGGFGAPQVVAIATGNSVVSPVSSDDLTMYLALGDTNGHEILVSKRASKGVSWPAPVTVAELKTSATRAEPSWISADGCRLYLTYNLASGKTAVHVATRPK